MQPKLARSNRGFTLIEILVAMALGLLVVGVAIQLYSKAVDATWRVTQRTQMQEDLRAAEDMMAKDISMAATGLTGQPGGVGLATGAGIPSPAYGCDQGQCYLPVSTRTGVNFPANPTPYLYWIIPGQGLGAQVFAGRGPTDAITVTYADMWFALQCYNVTFPNNTQATFTLQSPLQASCQTPALPEPVRAVSDDAYGLKAGDLVLFTNASGGVAVGEVTQSASGNGPAFTVNFATADALRLNQPGASAGSLQQMFASGTATTALRLLMISYYIDIPAITNIPTLMRQVNGQTPVPLAENIVDLRLDYDVYDANGNLLPNQGSPSPANINTIRKVNIQNLTARSSMRGTPGFQSLDVQTSVSVRNMSFQNRYAVK